MDITNDPALTHLYQIIRKDTELHGLLKEAEILSPSEYADLDDLSFADTEKRAYPIYDRDSTAVSAVYSLAYPDGVSPEVDATIKAAAMMHGINYSELAERVNAVAEELYKEATDGEVIYLLPSTNQYPVVEPEHVKTAQDWFSENYRDMPAGLRREFARNLCKVAEEFDIQPDLATLRVAGRLATDTSVLKQHLAHRTRWTTSDTAKLAYRQLISSLEEYPDEVSELAVQDKLSSLISQIDDEANFTGTQLRKLASCDEAVFNTVPHMEQTITVGDWVVPLAKFANVNLDVLAAILGDDIRDEICTNGEIDLQKVADVIPTIPMDEFSTLARVFEL